MRQMRMPWEALSCRLMRLSVWQSQRHSPLLRRPWQVLKAEDWSTCRVQGGRRSMAAPCQPLSLPLLQAQAWRPCCHRLQVRMRQWLSMCA